MNDSAEAASVRPCQCVWEGPTSDPRLVRPCVGHLVWMQEKRQKAVEAEVARERDQCAAIALRMHGSDGDQIAAKIRARGTL